MRSSRATQLAQFAVTGSLNADVLRQRPRRSSTTCWQLRRQVEPAFVAKTAIYARERGHMKDMPALLLAVLSTLRSGSCSRARFRA